MNHLESDPALCSGGSDSKESACTTGDPGSVLGLGNPVEEGMATHYSILTCEIPWTEEPGGLQSMGSQRVGHDQVIKHTRAHTIQCKSENGAI